MDIAAFLGAGLASEDPYKRWFAIHKEIEGGVDRGEIIECIKAVGPGAKFARSLRAAEKENAEEGDFVAVEVEDFGEAMFELGDAAVGSGGAGQALLAQGMQGVANSVFAKFHNRIAIGFLVGRIQDGIEGQRIVFGGGDFFFNERTKNASFGRGEEEVHGR